MCQWGRARQGVGCQVRFVCSCSGAVHATARAQKHCQTNLKCHALRPQPACCQNRVENENCRETPRAPCFPVPVGVRSYRLPRPSPRRVEKPRPNNGGGRTRKGGCTASCTSAEPRRNSDRGGQTKQGNRTKSPTDAVYLHTCSRVYLTIRFPTRPRRYRALSLALHCAPSQPLVALADPLGTSKGALKTPRARRTSSTAAQLISARTRPRPKPTPLLCRPVYCVYFTSLC